MLPGHRALRLSEHCILLSVYTVQLFACYRHLKSMESLRPKAKMMRWQYRGSSSRLKWYACHLCYCVILHIARVTLLICMLGLPIRLNEHMHQPALSWHDTAADHARYCDAQRSVMPVCRSSKGGKYCALPAWIRTRSLLVPPCIGTTCSRRCDGWPWTLQRCTTCCLCHPVCMSC